MMLCESLYHTLNIFIHLWTSYECMVDKYNLLGTKIKLVMLRIVNGITSVFSYVSADSGDITGWLPVEELPIAFWQSKDLC